MKKPTKISVLLPLIIFQLAISPPVLVNIEDPTPIVLQANEPHEIIDWASSSSKIVALTKQGMVYSKSNSPGGISNITPVNPQITQTIPILNFKGKVDCWREKDKCVICGIGGCYTITWTQNDETPVLNKIYFNKKFYPETKFSFDYVVQVLALDYTDYFFAIEGFYGTKSGGIVRYNADGSSNNCFVNWSPKLTGSDDQANPEYLIRRNTYSKYLSIVPKVSKKLYIIDYTSIGNTMVPLKSERNFGDFIPNFQDFDYIEGLYADKVNYIICGSTLTEICKHITLDLTGGSNSPTSPSEPIDFSTTTNSFQVLTGSGNIPIQTPIPTTVRVKTFPDSSKHFIVTYGKHFYAFEIKTSYTGKQDPIFYGVATPITTGEIIMIEDTLNTRQFLYSTDKMILETKFSKTSGAHNDNFCHPSCKAASSPFCNSYFRAQDCLGCLTTGTPKFKDSGIQNGVKCLLNIDTAIEQGKVLGGLSSFNEKPSSLTFSSTNQICTNTTILGTTGKTRMKN